MVRSVRVAMLAMLFASIPAFVQDSDAASVLDKASANYYLPSVRAVFGTFTYESTDLPTPFSRWVEDRLLLAAAGSTRVQILNRNAAAALDPVLRDYYGTFIK